MMAFSLTRKGGWHNKVLRGVLGDLIGNPVRLGSGPAAVTSFSFAYGGSLFAFSATVSTGNGKAAERERKPEDLPQRERV
jgi:hypothetical protein